MRLWKHCLLHLHLYYHTNPGKQVQLILISPRPRVVPLGDSQRRWIDHDDGDGGSSQDNSNVFVEGPIQSCFRRRDVSLSKQMVDCNINEHSSGQPHGNGIHPVCGWTLSCRVDEDTNGHTNWSGDGKCKSIRETGQKRSIWQHAQECNSHGYSCKYLVQ